MSDIMDHLRYLNLQRRLLFTCGAFWVVKKLVNIPFDWAWIINETIRI